MKIHSWPIVLTVVNVGILLAALFVLLPQATPTAAKEVAPSLRARSLELVDGGGTVRAQINVESSGEVILRLRDEKGHVRVKLGASEDGSGLVLLNDLTEAGVQMLAESTGTTLTLTAKNGQQEVIAP